MPRKPLHPAVKKKSQRMKKLGEAYRSGVFGNMTWREVIKKHLGSDKPVDQITGSPTTRTRTKTPKRSRTRRKTKSKSKSKPKRRTKSKTKSKRKSRRQPEFIYFDL